MPVTRPPPHRSQRAALPHWAPASGHHAKTFLGIRVIDADGRYPLAHQALHTFPGDAAFLTATREASLPEPRRLHLKPLQGLEIERYAIIVIVAQQYQAQPGALLGDR